MRKGSTRGKIDRMLESAPIVLGQRSLRLTAALEAWQHTGGNGGFVCAWGRVTPHAVVVQEGDEEYTILVTNPQNEIARWMVVGGLVVSALCFLIMLIAGRVSS